ncbi:hypothetical protein FSW04_01680 [Baekduia soli]|uniref:Uncharacterized protein n=1 Tax=Baekduia soli TaxID=496014 RepID=A0A5B8U0N5_9ACTN|nr:hypothetical protein [Baekduia soli]QEC46415.1 hypothetical protein FSW04_01680 [Baekduia soli]
MSTTDTIRPTAELTADVAESAGDGLRAAEIGVVVLIGLLACPPFLILAVVVAAPLVAGAALIAALVAPVLAVGCLVRRVRAHHRAHGTTLFLHRLRRS